ETGTTAAERRAGRAAGTAIAAGGIPATAAKGVTIAERHLAQAICRRAVGGSGHGRRAAGTARGTRAVAAPPADGGIVELDEAGAGRGALGHAGAASLSRNRPRAR